MKKTPIISLIFIWLFVLSSCQLLSPGSTEQGHNIQDHYRSYYEVFVYSFADSNGDGIGDFPGLTAKLDYINDGVFSSEDALGFDGIWLMPIMPSPTYHKYDVKDYLDIDPQYGTLEDFDAFMAEAQDRNIKVIIDLVLNHSSNEHPWFLEAIEALAKGETDHPYIDYYNFSQEKHNENWYETGAPGWYYEGVFWSGMPDFNLASERLRDEFKAIMEFWLLERQVDGFRLDAVKEFYSGENEKNIEFLQWVNDTAKSIKEEAYLIGEAWTSFGEYKTFYRSGIDSFFDFAFADQSGLAVRSINMEQGEEYAKNLANAQRLILEENPDAINASFLSNHDTGRLAGFLGRDINKLKLAAVANLVTSGSSFVYYGEEIGMRGSGRDENKRAPMPWALDSEALTRGPEAMEEDKHGYPLGTVEEQLSDPNSLLHYYRTLIRIRNTYPEFSRGISTYIEDFTSPALMPIEKEWTDTEGEVHRSLILVNFSSETLMETVPEAYADFKLVESLPNSNQEEVIREDSTITLPPYGFAIFR